MGIRPPWGDTYSRMATLRDETDDWYHMAIVKYQHSSPKSYTQAVISVVLFPPGQGSLGTSGHN